MEPNEEKSLLEVFCGNNGIALPDTISDDVICLEIAGVQDIWVIYLGNGEVEVYSRLDGLDVNDPGTLRLLLEANYLGMATEEARLSINPIESQVVLSERWPYQRLLADDALEDLARFAILAAAWRNEGVATIQAKIRGEEEEEGSEVPQDAAIFRL